MNLARAQLVETIRPTFHSINFTSGLPEPSSSSRPLAKLPEDHRPTDLDGKQRRTRGRAAKSENPQQPRRPKPISDSSLPSASSQPKNKRNGHFVVAGEKGYAVWASGFKVGEAEGDDIRSKRDHGSDQPTRSTPTDRPIKLFERDLNGSIDIALPLPQTPLLALVGGGREPVFPPNKVVIYHDHWDAPVRSVEPGLGPEAVVIPEKEVEGSRRRVGKVIASVEYSETVKAVKTRMNTLIVVLGESVIWYEYGMHSRIPAEKPSGPAAPGSKSVPPSISTPGPGSDDSEEDSDDPFGEDDVRRDKSRGVGLAKPSSRPPQGFWMVKRKEWKTCYNPTGLAALSTDVGSQLLAIPGRQPGHIQLVQLSPCISTSHADTDPTPTTASNLADHPSHPSFRSPIINAHSHTLSALACSTDGKYLVSSSERGSIFRIWNVSTGSIERELRRGVDKAVIWGIDLIFRPAREEGAAGSSTQGGRKMGKELWMVCWSDKGTVHVWGDVLGENRPTAAQTEAAKKNKPVTPKQALNSLLKPYIPVPKYFQAVKSSALFRLPPEEGQPRQPILTRPSPSSPSMRELALRERYVVVWQSVDVPRGAVDQVAGQDSTATTASASTSGYVPTLQLVLVTHAGEWYRLAVPERKYSSAETQTDQTGTNKDSMQEEDDPDMRVDRCRVIDYVDLSVVDDW